MKGLYISTNNATAKMTFHNFFLGVNCRKFLAWLFECMVTNRITKKPYASALKITGSPNIATATCNYYYCYSRKGYDRLPTPPTPRPFTTQC